MGQFSTMVCRVNSALFCLVVLVGLSSLQVSADTRQQSRLVRRSSDLQDGTSQEDFDEFFKLVEQLLWWQTDSEGRMYRRGYFNMRRPQILSRRSGEPASFYRSFVDECYGALCSLGINGLINRIGRM